jgi:hypothetical protein
MNSLRLFAALFSAAIGSCISDASAQSKKIDWQEINPGRLWVALHQNYGELKFSAVKFHLGYYKINLVDVSSYRERNIAKIRAVSDARKFSNSLLDAGIKVIFETWPDPTEIVAVAPAGWSTSLRTIEHAGLLKISGQQLSDFDDRKSLSAIVCLHNPSFRNYQYQVPTFYKTTDENQLSLAEKCKDAVQAGPRIIEDPSVNANQSGISDAEANLRPQSRVVFAVDDDPGREFPPGKPDSKLRENARNGYLIVTEGTVHLVDVQKMLLSAEFYNAGSKPHWAVNMAGGGPAGLVIRTGSDKNPTVVGNPSGVIGSAFVITKIVP